ncbi:tetratricopeptide repeat protein [Vibrio sp. SS-MA-C1-2]|uniref:tetratricopeptide repeat protein n=1 Tax=Vibrio sp. SS-MA-C1-2 TaxID=2908646 RepID=UPI001F2E48A8|nr:tetratricopeptide repeat protein [Vibrio sp. SS-MA-C1-2]UJF17273.1 tetratricopeptide repeat protein [Vibrio sp. SS-MA-C1-2]
MTNKVKETYQNGIKAIENHQFKKAIDLFQQVIHIEPDYSEAYFHLSTASMAEQAFSEAQTYLDKVIELEPAWPNGYFNAGRVASIQGEFDDAVGFFSVALKLGMETEQTLIARGIANHGCGRLADAIDDFDSVLVESIDITALKYRMACLLGMHRYQEALSDINVLIELQDEDQELFDIRKTCLQQLQNAPIGERIQVTELTD